MPARHREQARDATAARRDPRRLEFDANRLLEGEPLGVSHGARVTDAVEDRVHGGVAQFARPVAASRSPVVSTSLSEPER